MWKVFTDFDSIKCNDKTFVVFVSDRTVHTLIDLVIVHVTYAFHSKLNNFFAASLMKTLSNLKH